MGYLLLHIYLTIKVSKQKVAKKRGRYNYMLKDLQTFAVQVNLIQAD